MDTNITLEAITTELPPAVYTTERMLDRAGSRFSPKLVDMISRVGIRQRYSIFENYDDILFQDAEPVWADHGTEMAARAARSCMAESDATADQIGLVIALTNTPSRYMPGFVSDLMAKLRELPRDIPNISMQGQGCSILPKAVEVAGWFLCTSPEKKVLVVFQETTTALSSPLSASRYVSFAESREPGDNDATRQALHGFLFGDGAVAMLLGANGKGPVFSSITHLSNEEVGDEDLGYMIGGGSSSPVIYGRPIMRLGPGIPQRGAHYAQETLTRMQQRGDCQLKTLREADQILIHTGSHKILQGICEMFCVDSSSPEVSISFDILSKCGNLNGASLGFMIAQAYRQQYKKVVLISFGLGFSASAGTLIRQQ